ncbi:SAV_2336 N-terminal domain-related protein [Streptomyces bluensis]|uniref:SAV_2336 N-terminal domain-related protein n=1 Tax=Streptomyces bluensis TaxID=33897 RepID=A0ABW6UFP3_9ACTN
MSSAGDGPEGIGRLADLLAEAGGGEPPTSVELAELLWLAGHMEGPEDPEAWDGPEGPEAPGDSAADPHPAHRAGGSRAPSVPAPRPGPSRSARAPRAQQADARTGPAAPGTDPAHPDDRVPLRLPGTGPRGGGASHTALLAPAPPMLSHPLALQRALRPLKRRVPAPFGQEVDEEATAHRIARLGAAPQWWQPVLRPATERWLTLHLVDDSGPTMPVWGPLVRELHTALAQSGVFRTVESHRLAADGTVRRPGSQESYADGRTVTLIVSDCMGPQWREGVAGDRWYRTLRRWAARMPVAVVQPLPERLWRTTALPAVTARITSPSPAAPNSAYEVDSYLTDIAEPGSLPVPVLEPSAPWLANWSKLLGRAGRLPGSVALLGPVPPLDPVDELGRSDVERLSPEELVLRFRSIASPEAFRLAGHLALGRPELPVMRLLHAAIEPDPRPQHLAEVILSGLLTTVPGPAGSYDFRPGVRELLLRTLPRTAHGRTSELLARMGALIDERAGVGAREFRIAAPGDGGVPARGEPFAAVRAESLRRLGGAPAGGTRVVLGRYRLVRRLGMGSPQVWLAQDTRLDRTVAVYEYSARREHEPFLARARLIADLHCPNVIAALDHGVEGDVPYLVTEFVEGVSLAELTAEGGFRLPYWLLAPLALQVAKGLEAVHEQGLAHGRFTAHCLLLCPDGTVKITGFALGNVRGRTESKDLEEFGRLLTNLGGGPARSDDEPRPGLPRGLALFRARFPVIVDKLLNPSPDVQRQGRSLFRAPSFTEVLEAVAEDRYQYRLLGPVRVDQRGLPLPVDDGPAQALLCMLVLRHGRTVTNDELIEGLWGEHRPERPLPELAALASSLRAALGPGLLATTADGYALHAMPSAVDVLRCEDLVARVNSRRAEGDPAAARASVQYALDLWYGDPLDGVPGPAAEAARGRLSALRLSLYATRAELDLELGHFEQAAADLAPHLQEFPEHEEFRRLHALAQRSASESGRATLTVEITDPGPHPETHRFLGRTLPWLLSLGDLDPSRYELLTRDNGYVVVTEPGTPVLPVLHAVLRELPGALMDVDDPPAIRVTFWHTAQFTGADRPAGTPDLTSALGGRSPADIVVVLSPVLHQELTAATDRTVDPAGFLPLRGSSPDTPPDAWYLPLDLPEPAPVPEHRDLVRGPFTVRHAAQIRPPLQGRTAVVYTGPDGRLTELDPHRPHSGRPAHSRVTYYEVDLTAQQATRQLLLPAAGRTSTTFVASAELSWHVDDPLAFVRAEASGVAEQLFEHLTREAARITRRHPLRWAGTAQRAVHEGVRAWPVPGLSVSFSMRLSPGPAPRLDQMARDQDAGTAPADGLALVLAHAESVLLGFDGTLARIPARRRTRMARALAEHLVELRHPDDALSGAEPLLQGAPAPLEEEPDPLALLRSLAHHRLAPELSRALDGIERQNLGAAVPSPFAGSLVYALADRGLGVAVVTDHSSGAVAAYLARRGLTGSASGGVHGRSDDPGLLLPHPDCLLRALERLHTAPDDAVLIGSSVTELTAASDLGLPFIGYATGREAERRLREAGCRYTVSSLEPLLKAVRPA